MWLMHSKSTSNLHQQGKYSFTTKRDHVQYQKVCVQSRILGDAAGIRAKFPTTCLSLVSVHKWNSVRCNSQHHASACDALCQFLLSGRRTPYHHHEQVDFHPRNWKEHKPQRIRKMTYWSCWSYSMAAV